MKYLILLLALFMVSNVNAENDVDSLTYEQKQTFIHACETDNFGRINDVQKKAFICHTAATIKSSSAKTNRQALLDMARYAVKSCNYYDLEYRKDVCDVLYEEYKQACFINRDEQMCNILKGYYKLY